MSTVRHFLRDDDLTPGEQAEVLALAAAPDVIRLAPPLIITEAQIDSFLTALPAILDEAVA